MIALRPMSYHDFLTLLRTMRQEDKGECLVAGAGRSLQEDYAAIQGGVNFSVFAQNGTLLACGGYQPNGLIWMLCTYHVVHHHKAVLKRAKRLLAAIKASTGLCLFNAVWRGNLLHIRWLQHLGARLYPATHDFIPFTL